jgi:trehalose utilization protein
MDQIMRLAWPGRMSTLLRMNPLFYILSKRTLWAVGALGLTASAIWADDKINVLVWDEQQPVPKKVYAHFPGNHVADHLKKNPRLNVTSANINQPEQGLSTKALDEADVLIYWGHVRHRDISEAKSQEIVGRIKTGKLGFVVLHSAHWSVPFMVAMQEVAAEAALEQLPENLRAQVDVRYKGELGWHMPKPDARPYQLHEFRRGDDGQIRLLVERPNCVFPRCCTPVQSSQVRIINKKHPITKGIPATFTIPETEMYDEPFHVPTPDEVILDETWEGGEYFRSGAIWSLGQGKVFYFRPGDQQYAVYKIGPVLKILENAAIWLGAKAKH